MVIIIILFLMKNILFLNTQFSLEELNIPDIFVENIKVIYFSA